MFFPKGFGPIRASYQSQGYKRCQSQAWQAGEGPVVPEPREGEIMPCIYPCVTRWYNGGLSSTDPWWYLNILSVVRCPSELRGRKILSIKLSWKRGTRKQGSGEECSHFPWRSTSHCWHCWTISTGLSFGMLSMLFQSHSQLAVSNWK